MRAGPAEGCARGGIVGRRTPHLVPGGDELTHRAGNRRRPELLNLPPVGAQALRVVAHRGEHEVSALAVQRAARETPVRLDHHHPRGALERRRLGRELVAQDECHMTHAVDTHPLW